MRVMFEKGDIMKKLFVIAAAVAIAAGCAESRSGSVYTRDQARTTMHVSYGKVIDVRPVQIEGTKTPVGVIAGGAGGVAVGSTIGGGSGKTVATVLGGLAGAAAGAAAEEQLTKKDGLEITVKLDSGDTIAIVQEADEVFSVGESVSLLRGNDGSARVRH